MGKWLEAAIKVKAEMDKKDNTITSLREKIERLKEVKHWLELDIGASVKVGDEVRYLMRYYTCIKAHTKSLTRTPLDTTYWQETAESA